MIPLLITGEDFVDEPEFQFQSITGFSGRFQSLFPARSGLPLNRGQSGLCDMTGQAINIQVSNILMVSFI
jgi:hypothetical protein